MLVEPKANEGVLVDISVGNRFHAFDLARELDRLGAMRTLHTGYPAFAATRFGLRPGMIRSVWSHEPLTRLLGALRSRGYLSGLSNHRLNVRFDRIVARRLRNGASHFIGWSGMCGRSMFRARQLGAILIVERGSTHIRWQQRILSEEARLTGKDVAGPDEATVQTELEEYERADYIAVPTRFVADTFAEEGVPRDKLLLNPYGVDLSRFGFVERRPSDGRLAIIHAGRCSLRKGAHHLAAAVGSVEGASVAFVGAIDSEAADYLQAPHCVARGPVPGSELPARYARADVFCLLSIEEGMAMVLAQAMATGLPVIATPNTGAEELISDGVEGFIVPVRSPEVVAARLRHLRDHPAERLEMGRRARKRVETGFGWGDYGRRALDHYRRILHASA